MLHDWQDRVIEEKRELDMKLADLEAFIAGDECAQLDPYEQDLLKRQAHYMTAYSATLAQRIDQFSARKG